MSTPETGPNNKEFTDALTELRAYIDMVSVALRERSPSATSVGLFIGENGNHHMSVDEATKTHATIHTSPTLDIAKHPDLYAFQKNSVDGHRVAKSSSTVGRMTRGQNGLLLPSSMNPEHHMTSGVLSTSGDTRVVTQAVFDNRLDLRMPDQQDMQKFFRLMSSELGRIAELGTILGMHNYNYELDLGEPTSSNAAVVGIDLTSSTDLSSQRYLRFVEALGEFVNQPHDGVELLQFCGDGALFGYFYGRDEARQYGNDSTYMPAAITKFASEAMEWHEKLELDDPHTVRIAASQAWLDVAAGNHVGDTLFGIDYRLERMPRDRSSIVVNTSNLTRRGESVSRVA